ncbi:hypothetical protein IEE94_11085 [Yimella sp. cx-573]|nr:hypothetical protein [Yimella sp. cx-573]
MTSPRHAEATAKGRYYTHPQSGEQLISVTNVLSVSCAKPALVPWAAKIAAEWAVEHLPSLVKMSRTDPDQATKDIKAQVTVARDKAADLGSAVHAAAERHALGQPPIDDEYAEQVKPFLSQYLRFLDEFGIDLGEHIEATEMTVANPALGYAGTLDLLLWLPVTVDLEVSAKEAKRTGAATVKVKRLPDGERALWLVDIKTSSTRAATSVYGEYALQLAGLRFATEMWLPDDTVRKFTAPIVGCAVLNLRPRTYELIPLPAWTDERNAFAACLTHAKWAHGIGHSINGGDARPITPAGAIKPKRTRKTTTTKTSTKAA